MRVFVVNDTSDNVNWGCRATSSALDRLIRQTGAEITGRAHLSKLSRPDVLGLTRARRRFPGPVTQTAERLVRRVDRRGALAIAPHDAGSLDELIRAALRGRGPLAADVDTIRSSDVVLINGEGSIYDRQYKGLILFAYAVLAHGLDARVALVNHSADLHDRVMSDVAAAASDSIDDIVVREPRSVGEWQRIDVTADVAGDAAFLHVPLDRSSLVAVAARDGYFSTHPHDAGGFDPSRPYAVVSGSSVFLRPDRGSIDPTGAYVRMCQALRRELGQVIVVIPAPEDEFLAGVAARVGLPIIGPHTPVEQALQILGNASVLVSGRWHPSVLASTGGTPCVMIDGNTHKCQAFLDLMEIDAEATPAAELDDRVDEVVRAACDAVGAGEPHRHRILDRVAALRAGVDRHVAILRDAR